MGLVLALVLCQMALQHKPHVRPVPLSSSMTPGINPQITLLPIMVLISSSGPVSKLAGSLALRVGMNHQLVLITNSSSPSFLAPPQSFSVRIWELICQLLRMVVGSHLPLKFQTQFKIWLGKRAVSAPSHPKFYIESALATIINPTPAKIEPSQDTPVIDGIDDDGIVWAGQPVTVTWTWTPATPALTTTPTVGIFFKAEDGEMYPLGHFDADLLSATINLIDVPFNIIGVIIVTLDTNTDPSTIVMQSEPFTVQSTCELTCNGLGKVCRLEQCECMGQFLLTPENDTPSSDCLPSCRSDCLMGECQFNLDRFGIVDIEDTTCQCQDGWAGEDCGADTTTSTQCRCGTNNTGSSLMWDWDQDGNAVYDPDQCSVDDPTDLSWSYCSCPNNYRGANCHMCSVEETMCHPEGTLVNTPTRTCLQPCQCKPGWAGVDCKLRYFTGAIFFSGPKTTATDLKSVQPLPLRSKPQSPKSLIIPQNVSS